MADTPTHTLPAPTCARQLTTASNHAGSLDPHQSTPASTRANQPGTAQQLMPVHQTCSGQRMHQPVIVNLAQPNSPRRYPRPDARHRPYLVVSGTPTPPDGRCICHPGTCRHTLSTWPDERRFYPHRHPPACPVNSVYICPPGLPAWTELLASLAPTHRRTLTIAIVKFYIRCPR